MPSPYPFFRPLSPLLLALTLGAAGPATPLPAERRPDTASALRLPPVPPESEPPRPESPVENFRRLLAADLATRADLLAGKSAGQREFLTRQLSEFDSLTPAERESRLRLFELRFHLSPLLNTAPDARKERMRFVPPAYREAVKDRLAAWDALAPELRAELIDNQAALQHLARFPGALEKADLDEAQRAQLERAVARWQGMPAAERQQMVGHLHRFFQLGEADQQRTLARVTGGARPRFEALMADLRNLPAAERDSCLQSLGRFATLSPAERERFLRNALRWTAMSPDDRQAWRQLNAKLPPLPPFLPPSPGAAQARR